MYRVSQKKGSFTRLRCCVKDPFFWDDLYVDILDPELTLGLSTAPDDEVWGTG